MFVLLSCAYLYEIKTFNSIQFNRPTCDCVSCVADLYTECVAAKRRQKHRYSLQHDAGETHFNIYHHLPQTKNATVVYLRSLSII